MTEMTAARRCMLGTWLIASWLCPACKMQVPEGEFACESAAQCPKGWSCLETDNGSRCYSSRDGVPVVIDGGPEIDANRPPEDSGAPQPNLVDSGGDVPPDDVDAGGGAGGQGGAAGVLAAGSGGMAGVPPRAGSGPIGGMGGAGSGGRPAAGSGGMMERCGTPGGASCANDTAVRLCGEDGSWSAPIACGSPCTSGRCAPIMIAANQKGVQGFALDATNFYWSTNEGYIRRLAQAGGQPVDIVVGAANPAGLALNKTTLFYAQVQGTGAIWRWDLAGTSKSVVHASGQMAPQGVVIDATRAYWANHVANGSVMSMLLVGGLLPTAVATGESGPVSVAVDGTSAYWTNYEGGTVRKVALGGTGAPITLASAQMKPSSIRLDDTNVYWTTSTGDVSMIAKVPTLGGAPVTIATGTAGSIAVDGRYVYVSGANGIEKISIANRAHTVLVDPPATKTAREIAAVTANALYWLEFDAGRVMKVAK